MSSLLWEVMPFSMWLQPLMKIAQHKQVGAVCIHYHVAACLKLYSIVIFKWSISIYHNKQDHAGLHAKIGIAQDFPRFKIVLFQDKDEAI